MRLFLSSDTTDPTTSAAMQEFAGGFGDKKMAYVATAGNAEGYGSWRKSESFQYIKGLDIGELVVVELEDFKIRNVVAEILRADIVFLAGGLPGYLLYWMRRLQMEEKIREMLENDEKVLIGTSAGSQVCSKTQSLEWTFGDEEHGANVIPGLGLVDFEVYPHYEDELFGKIEEKWVSGILYLIKNGEAVIVENNSVKVLGEERVIRK